MLTHEINKYFPPVHLDKAGKPKFINGSEDHRKFLLSRTVKTVLISPDYWEGQHYWIKGRSQNAQLLTILEDYKDVKWNGLKCLCMEVYIPEENTTDLFHPSDLRKSRKH